MQSALSHTPPLHSVAVQRSTPHYSDRYPYVRYSYGNPDTTMAILSQTDTVSPRTDRYTLRDSNSRSYLDTKLSTSPSYTSRVERPITPSRNYVR
jgi:hypothetical protein